MMKKIIKTGVGSMVGMYTLGAVANVPGMPAQAKDVAGIGSTALQLGNIGVLSETAMGVMKVPKMKKGKKSKNSMW